MNHTSSSNDERSAQTSRVVAESTTPNHAARGRSAATSCKPQIRRGTLAIDVQEEMRVLEALKANLTVHHELLEDDELMLVLAEGETSLLEMIDLMLDADFDDEGLISGLKRNKDTLAVRLHRLEERRQSRRALLEQALVMLQRKSLERPCATITLTDRAPALIVEEEAQVPARFFDLKPVINRRLAKQALEAGEIIPGARLSNGSITLTVRRR